MAAKSAGVPTGMHCPDAETVNMRAAQGFQFLALAADARLMMAKAGEEVAKLDLPEE